MVHSQVDENDLKHFRYTLTTYLILSKETLKISFIYTLHVALRPHGKAPA